MITLDPVRGHYINVLPVFVIFPRKAGFREDFISIHLGWWKWKLHIKIGVEQ